MARLSAPTSATYAGVFTSVMSRSGRGSSEMTMRLFHRHQTTEPPVVASEVVKELTPQERIKRLERACNRTVKQLANPNLVVHRPQVEAKLLRMSADLEQLKGESS